MSKAWLVAGGLLLVQGLSLLQLTVLNNRIVQIEAGVEFWEYGQQGCTAPAQGKGQAPVRGGLAAWLPGDAV